MIRSAARVSITTLTDGTLGTASNSLAEIIDTYAEATLANAYASLAAKINEALAELNTKIVS